MRITVEVTGGKPMPVHNQLYIIILQKETRPIRELLNYPLKLNVTVLQTIHSSCRFVIKQCLKCNLWQWIGTSLKEFVIEHFVWMIWNIQNAITAYPTPCGGCTARDIHLSSVIIISLMARSHVTRRGRFFKVILVKCGNILPP
jgi:hypothetical protein